MSLLRVGNIVATIFIHHQKQLYLVSSARQSKKTLFLADHLKSPSLSLIFDDQCILGIGLFLAFIHLLLCLFLLSYLYPNNINYVTLNTNSKIALLLCLYEEFFFS